MSGKRRVGIYPGTFDPVTHGHLDIIKRGAGLVDELIIAVAINEEKKPLFTLAERTEMLELECAKMKDVGIISVRPFDTLLVHFAKSVGATVIVKGLRSTTDFEYEFQMTSMNRDMEPGIETIFLTADASHQAVASSLVKQIARMGGDFEKFVPPEAARRLKEKFRGS
jgi:pantetheine-phosphate adenylyltransferase